MRPMKDFAPGSEFAAEIFRQAGMHVNVVPVGERRISCKGRNAPTTAV